MSSKNAEIKTAIDSFDLSRARDLLREAMPEANAETLYLASRAALDDEQRLEFLERAVALDPFHEAARTALRQMKSAAGSAPAASAAAPAAAPSGAPASSADETSRYVRALGVHKFRADIPIASGVDLRLIEDFFVGLGYKRKRSSDLAYNLGVAVANRSAQHDQGYMRSGELTFTRWLAFIAASSRAKVTVLPGSVTVVAECDLPHRTKHLADIVAIDAALRAELDDLATTLVSGRMTTERAVKAQVDLERALQSGRKEWIKEQNSPMQIILVVVGVVILLLLFSSGFWDSLLGAFF